MGRNPLFKKLKGYQKAPRDRFQLLSNKVLSQEELALYELGIAITDWDEEHTETYGTFQATDIDLAGILGWKVASTVNRHRRSLITKGWFIEREDSRITAKDFHQWELRRNSSAKMHKADADTQTFNSEKQIDDAEMQRNQPQNNSYPLGSYKGNLVSFDSSSYEDISDEEMDKIAIEIDRKRREDR